MSFRSIAKLALGTGLVAVLLFLFFLVFWFRTALGQPTTVGTVRTILAAAKLELNHSEIVDVAPGVWLMRFHDSEAWEIGDEALDDMLARRGWGHPVNEGTWRWYDRHGIRLAVSCPLYSRRYLVCTALGPF